MKAAGVEHLPRDAPSDAIHEVLLRDGAVVVDDLAEPATIARLRDDLRPYIEATPHGSDAFAGRHTRRTGALIARSAASHELVRHPLVLDVTGRLLHQATNFQLHLTQTIAIGPGQPAQPLHRDQWAFDFFPFPADHHVQCNTIWALTDFTEANGATRIVPGSQDLPDSFDRSAAADATVPAEMTTGSCLVYTGKVLHGGGANTSDDTRIGANITYVVGWLRQEENQYLSVPREVAETLDDDLLRLMGYRTGAYALGYIDDVRDPLEALRGRTGTMSFGGSDPAPDPSPKPTPGP
jgi:ectoine hydroxylase-related dioxygenase (phytanoyl-CoA dioxygenase family)